MRSIAVWCGVGIQFFLMIKSATAVGGVGEGRAEEGDVVGLVGLGFEVDLDDLKKGRVDAEAAEVVADAKEEAVAASGWVGDEGGVAAAVAVCSCFGEEFVGGVEELDGNALGGFAVGGVEDVGADFLHGNISADGGPNSKEGVWLGEETGLGRWGFLVNFHRRFSRMRRRFDEVE